MLISFGFLVTLSASLPAAQPEELLQQISLERDRLHQLLSRKQEIALHLEESRDSEIQAMEEIQSIIKETEIINESIEQLRYMQNLDSGILAQQELQLNTLHQNIQAEYATRVKKLGIFFNAMLQQPNPLQSSSQHWPDELKRKLLTRLAQAEWKSLEESYQLRATLQNTVDPLKNKQEDRLLRYQEHLRLKQALERNRADQQRTLITLQQDRQIYFRYLHDLQEKIERIEASLVQRERQYALALRFKRAQGLKGLKGSLPSPLEGSLVQPYREKVKDKHASNIVFRGILIESPKAAYVQSIALGKVVFAEPLEGYFNLVIVDHGNNDHSVYGNLQELQVVKDQYVARGETLGLPAPDLLTLQFRTYFEIRIRGKSVNPLNYIKE